MDVRSKVRRIETALRKMNNLSDEDLKKLAEKLFIEWLPDDPEAEKLIDEWLDYYKKCGYEMEIPSILYHMDRDPVLIELDKKINKRLDFWVSKKLVKHH